MIGREIRRHEQVVSTNDLVRELAFAGEPEGLVITAEDQSAGRGRLGRRWIAPPRTSLQLSVLLRPSFGPPEGASLMQMAALAITHSLRMEYGLEPILKWPNDVLLNEKKCAGILVETVTIGGALAFAILGIGINGNFDMSAFPELSPTATTISDEVGHDVGLAQLESVLLAELDRYYQRVNEGHSQRRQVFMEWRSQLSTIGRLVRLTTPQGIESGIAEDVDTDGALLLKRGGERVRVYAGDVSVLRE